MVQLERWADALAGWRRVKIDAARCLPQVSPRCRCDACAAICPEGAIALGAAPAVRDCSACGLCAAACKADAIVLDNPSDEQLVQRFASLGRKAGRLSLTCMTGPKGPEQIGCLGRLTPEILLAGVACGFTEIELVAGRCAGCRYARGREMVEEAVRQVDAILRQLSHPCRMNLLEAPDWKPEAEKQQGSGVQAPVYEERRAFLLSAFGLLRELLPLAPERPAKAEPAVPPLSRRREILLWALRQAGVDEQATVAWGVEGLRLTGRCFHCGVCQRLCPNGAIKAAADTGLQLHPKRCHACGLCTEVCPVGALSLSAPYSVADIAGDAPMALGEVSAYCCARCGEPAEATGEGELLCLACGIRPRHQEVICR